MVIRCYGWLKVVMGGFIIFFSSVLIIIFVVVVVLAFLAVLALFSGKFDRTCDGKFYSKFDRKLDCKNIRI